jgi:hypothetical protein
MKTFSMLSKIKLGKRSGLKCMICFDQITEAKKFSRNGQVPMADGILVMNLIEIAVDVHNDSKVLTLSANS